MNRAGDEVEYEVTDGDLVVLSHFELQQAYERRDPIAEFILGERDWFPAFDAPVFEGEQGWVEVEPGRYENRGFHGGAADGRLHYFAHMVRPFAWVHDPRRDRLQDLVGNSLKPDGAHEIREASTQDLWDAMFTFARGERFFDGLIALNARELTTVANEIRRRLLLGRQGVEGETNG